MRSGGLRRAVAVRIARWVQAWADHVAWEEPAAVAPPPPEEPERGALEEWVARVQAAAPELLVGLDLPPAPPRRARGSGSGAAGAEPPGAPPPSNPRQARRGGHGALSGRAAEASSRGQAGAGAAAQATRSEMAFGPDRLPADDAGAPAAPPRDARRGGHGALSGRAAQGTRTEVSFGPDGLPAGDAGALAAPRDGARGRSEEAGSPDGAGGLRGAASHGAFHLGDGAEASASARATQPRTLRWTERAWRAAQSLGRSRSGARSSSADRPMPAQDRDDLGARTAAFARDPTPQGREREEDAAPHGGGWLNPPSPDVAAHAPPLVEGRTAWLESPGDAARRGHAWAGGLSERALQPVSLAAAPEPDWSRAPPSAAGAVESSARGASLTRAADPDLAPWRGADLPNPWPELPPEPPPTDLEDAFLRRLERLHRIEREQRGD